MQMTEGNINAGIVHLFMQSLTCLNDINLKIAYVFLNPIFDTW